VTLEQHAGDIVAKDFLAFALWNYVIRYKVRF